MQWRKEEKWEKWVDRIIDGEKIDFTHLRSFDMSFERPASGTKPAIAATIRVVFDCHVVTTKHTAIEEGPSYWRDTGGYCRVFERVRYEKSRILPGIIAALPVGKTSCYVAKRNNYMVWKPEGAGPGDAHYQAFFDIYKAVGQDGLLILYVQSAYLKDEPLAIQRERKKPFGQICAELLGAIPPKEKGPNQKSKRKRR